MAFNPFGIGIFPHATVGYRLRLFTFIPGGDEMLLLDQDLCNESIPLGEDQGENMDESDGSTGASLPPFQDQNRDWAAAFGR